MSIIYVYIEETKKYELLKKLKYNKKNDDVIKKAVEFQYENKYDGFKLGEIEIKPVNELFTTPEEAKTELNIKSFGMLSSFKSMKIAVINVQGTMKQKEKDKNAKELSDSNIKEKQKRMTLLRVYLFVSEKNQYILTDFTYSIYADPTPKKGGTQKKNKQMMNKRTNKHKNKQGGDEANENMPDENDKLKELIEAKYKSYFEKDDIKLSEIELTPIDTIAKALNKSINKILPCIKYTTLPGKNSYKNTKIAEIKAQGEPLPTIDKLLKKKSMFTSCPKLIQNPPYPPKATPDPSAATDASSASGANGSSANALGANGSNGSNGSSDSGNSGGPLFEHEIFVDCPGSKGGKTKTKRLKKRKKKNKTIKQ